MTLKDSVRSCFGKYVTFSGRASRSEFWWFYLFLVLAGLGLFLVGVVLTRLFGLDTSVMGDETRRSDTFFVLPAILPAIFILATFLPMLSVQVRRFHDRNMSGWWIIGFSLLGAIPFVGWLFSLISLIITILKGTPGPNRFGPDPLAAQHGADVFS